MLYSSKTSRDVFLCFLISGIPCSQVKFILYWVRLFTYALCKTCLRYLLLLPRAQTFEIYSKCTTNYTAVTRKQPGPIIANDIPIFFYLSPKYEICSLQAWHLNIYTMLYGPGSLAARCFTTFRTARVQFRASEGLEIFLQSFVCRLVLGSTQPPIKWVPGAFLGLNMAEHRTSHSSSS